MRSCGCCGLRAAEAARGLRTRCSGCGIQNMFCDTARLLMTRRCMLVTACLEERETETERQRQRERERETRVRERVRESERESQRRARETEGKRESESERARKR